VGNHDCAKDGYGDYYGEEMYGYDIHENYCKKGYADDYFCPQYGVRKYYYDKEKKNRGKYSSSPTDVACVGPLGIRDTLKVND